MPSPRKLSFQAGRIPTLPATQSVLPKPIASARLRSSTGALPYAISSVYDYWLGKRKRSHRQGPLLQHLWFEEPWKVCVVCMDRSCL